MILKEAVGAVASGCEQRGRDMSGKRGTADNRKEDMALEQRTGRLDIEDRKYSSRTAAVHKDVAGHAGSVVELRDQTTGKPYL